MVAKPKRILKNQALLPPQHDEPRMSQPRQDALETAFVLIEILRVLPKSSNRGRQITAKEVQAHLATQGYVRDVRTVQRQLDGLSSRFNIVRDDRNKPYGYCWDPLAQGLALPQLTPQESVLLTFAYHQLGNLLPANLRQGMRGHFDQARYLLNQQPGSALERQWLKKVRVIPDNQPLLPAQIDDHILDTISQALYENRYLTLRYTNAKGEEKSKSRVMPLGLAQQGPRIYLVARFEGYANQRILALHRMLEASREADTFHYPTDFNLADYDRDGSFGFGDGQLIEVHFSINKDVGFHLTETPLSADQTIEEHADHYRVRARLMESQLLDRWLKGWGNRVWAIEYHPVEHGQQEYDQKQHGTDVLI